MCGKSGFYTIPNWIIQSRLFSEAIPHIFDKCTAAFHLKVFVSCIASHQLFSRTRRGQKQNLWITTHIALLDVSPRLVMIGNNIVFNQEHGTMPGSIRCIEMLSHWVISCQSRDGHHILGVWYKHHDKNVNVQKHNVWRFLHVDSFTYLIGLYKIVSYLAAKLDCHLFEFQARRRMDLPLYPVMPSVDL